jgi:hypothetical protein
MDKQTKRQKIKAMKDMLREYRRRRDKVLSDQMERSIAEAKATW